MSSHPFSNILRYARFLKFLNRQIGAKNLGLLKHSSLFLWPWTAKLHHLIRL
jgi:hypothetical protein